jgi:hypothetical protein
MGNPLNPGLQPAAINLGPTDKYVIISLQDGSVQPQVLLGPNQSTIDSLLLLTGALETVVMKLMSEYPNDSRIVQPFASPVRLNPNGDKKGNEPG